MTTQWERDFLCGDENALALDRGGGCNIANALNASELFTLKCLILCNVTSSQ